jgi:mannose-1-phosphate guanylyltransferase
MEKAKEVYVLRGNFGWSDVGSWDEVYRISGKDENGNSITGQAFLHNTKNTMVYSGSKIVAAVGVDDLIIITTDDAVLVCKQGQSQEVKEVVDYLRRKQKVDYL